MTFQMKIYEEREEAKEEAIKETLFNNIKALVQKEGWSFEKAFDVLGVSPENRVLFLKNMQKTTLMN
ncbi:MAG: hypothetical protein J6M62_11525 [Selenomonadaceae bacterium]|nr:hypothetical protein [Selenomonadaceae bacterium]